MNTVHDDDAQGVFVRRVLTAIALVALAVLAWRLRELLLLLFGAVLVAVVLRTMADPLGAKLRVSHGAALAATVLLLGGAFALLFRLFGPRVGEQARVLSASLPDAWSQFEARIGDTALGERLMQLAQAAAPSGSGLLSSAGQFAASFTASVADAVLVLVAGFYLAAQPGLYRGGALKLLPTRRRAVTDEALGDSGRALRLWLGGQLMSMIVVAVLMGGGLWLIGVPLPLLLGLLAGLFNFIPLAGPIIAAVPAVLLALTVSPSAALWTLGLTVFIQQVEGNILLPLFQQKAVDLPPVLLLFALVAFGSLFGALGVILAAPLTVVAFVLVKRLYVRDALGTPTSVPGENRP